jgi:hypothetical protein
MMGGWEAATAIIGVAAVIGSTWASIHKTNRRPDREPAEVSNLEPRLVKLEADMGHVLAGQGRLEDDNREARQRHEDVVAGIYQAIDGLRQEILDIVKQRRAS